MATNYIYVQSAILNQLRIKKNYMRERIYKLKKKHSSLGIQIKKLSAQCGILDKPALMIDYDMTVECCEEGRKINQYLKQTMAGIEKKLRNLLRQNAHVK